MPDSNGGRRRRRPPLSLCRNLAWEARRPAPGGFEWAAPEPGVLAPLPPGPFGGRSRIRFPRWLPDRAEALTVRRLAVWNSRSSSRHLGSSAEALVPKMAGSSAEASVPPGVHGPKSWVRRFRSSRAETRSCPANPGPKPRLRRWRRANRSPAFRRTGPEPEGPVSRLMVSHVPEGRLETGGCFTKPTAFASAKGQARSFRLAAASSAALPFASARPAARRRPAWHKLRLWLGRRPSVAGRSSRPRPETVTKDRAGKAQSTCG